jgi:hypothetical protein
MVKYKEIIGKRAWPLLSEKERLEVLTEIEAAAAALLGRKTRIVVFDDINDDGYFDEDKQRIVINRKKSNNAPLTVETVLHEGRHAFQSDVIKGLLQHKNKLDWAKNWKAYLDPANDDVEHFEYFLQPIEHDANRFALEQLYAIGKKAKSPEFLKHYQRRLVYEKGRIQLAVVEYGKNYKKAIMSKIDSALAQNKKLSSYSEVNKRLAKEGLLEEGPAFVDRIIFKKDADVKPQDRPIAAPAANEKPQIPQGAISEQQKALAKKYGFSEKAAAKVLKVLEYEKTQEKNNAIPQEKTTPNKVPPKKDDTLTVKVSVKADKNKGR